MRSFKCSNGTRAEAIQWLESFRKWIRSVALFIKLAKIDSHIYLSPFNWDSYFSTPFRDTALESGDGSKLKLCPVQVSHFLRRLGNQKEEGLEEGRTKMSLQFTPNQKTNEVQRNSAPVKMENRRPLPTYQRSITSHSGSPGSPSVLKDLDQVLEQSSPYSRNSPDEYNLNNYISRNSLSSSSCGGGSDYESRDRVDSFPKLDPTSIPKILRRNNSFSECTLDGREQRVLVIYTGGTIGMTRTARGGKTSF